MTDTVDPALTARLTRIRAKADWLRARDSDAARLNPPATEAGVAAREAELGIGLPAGYRAFITALGDGGACYDRRFLPFVGDTESVGPIRGGYPGGLLVARFQSTCSADLVVTGPARGRVVYHREDTRPPGTPVAPPRFPPAADFPAWYETWLDSGISGLPLPLLGLELAEPQGSPFHDFYVRDLMLLAAAVDRADQGEDGPVDGETLGVLARRSLPDRVRFAAVCSLSRGPEHTEELRAVAEEADGEVAGLARVLLRVRA